jgi:uncharacterized membrane protein
MTREGGQPMEENTVARASKRLRSPRAAAVAGILFSSLLIAVLVLMLASAPKDPLDDGAWLSQRLGNVVFAIYLMPFVGVAFLWFIGVVRDRLGEAEDQLFATVFLGSALLFLATMFAAAAAFGAIVIVHGSRPEGFAGTQTFAFARAFAFVLVNVYAVKMASVFMIVTSTLALRTGFLPRWIAIPGLAMALFLLFGSQLASWSFGVFPLWAMIVSLYILFDNFKVFDTLRRAAAAARQAKLDGR